MAQITDRSRISSGRTGERAHEFHPPPPPPSKNKPKEIDFSDPSVMFRHVLYVHPDSHPSTDTFEIIESTPWLSKEVWVQSIGDLKDDELDKAPWIDGVPILVDKRSGDIHKGHAACRDALACIQPTIVPRTNDGFGISTTHAIHPGHGVSKN
jgi:hypothetical protein